MSDQVIYLNHVALVVEDLDTALTFWRDALGLTVGHTESNPDEAVDVAFLPTGDSTIELLKPTDPESGVAKYLAKKGQGIHHICLQVADLDATIQRLTGYGFEMINDTARIRPDGTRYAFVHPKSAFGVLVELYEA